jgi:hypothetical protein
MLKIESEHGVIIKPDQLFMKKVESTVLRDQYIADEMKINNLKRDMWTSDTKISRRQARRLEWLVVHQRAIEIELRNREVFPEVFIDVAAQENMVTRSASLVGGPR